jgi:hypothetical protein
VRVVRTAVVTVAIAMVVAATIAAVVAVAVVVLVVVVLVMVIVAARSHTVEGGHGTSGPAPNRVADALCPLLYEVTATLCEDSLWTWRDSRHERGVSAGERNERC